jgi:hypothetical protein
MAVCVVVVSAANSRGKVLHLVMNLTLVEAHQYRTSHFVRNWLHLIRPVMIDSLGCLGCHPGGLTSSKFSC